VAARCSSDSANARDGAATAPRRPPTASSLLRRRAIRIIAAMLRAACGLASLSLVLCCMPACVEVDPKTGETIPRGNQKFYYSEVTEKAKRLEAGMSKLDVLLLLGSAAEQSENGDTWVYLPERPGVLVPASALKLEFGPAGLAEWGYHPIVLGVRM
jgi:outer membrane protein assembly factor BamE (lipoprotein component of BamABCDE complex)